MHIELECYLHSVNFSCASDKCILPIGIDLRNNKQCSNELLALAQCKSSGLALTA